MTDVSQDPTAAVLDEIRGTRDALTVGRVYGDAYEVDGVTLIPVARVAGGGGGGGEDESKSGSGKGFGSGFGMNARAIGVYEVRDGNVTWKPAVDATRLAKGGQVLAGIIAVCVTLVLLARSR
jgi:uncharacterized spore protein YtfJ